MTLGLLLVTASAIPPAMAQAQWAGTPWPGVRHIARTDPGPVRVRALEVDLCDAGMTVRASTPEEANQTVSRWAGAVGVQAAINANMWHCGALCGVGIGNGRVFDAPDDGHWGYIAFSPDLAEYPWDYDTIPPAAWVEQAVGGHPRIVNGGAPIPEFAGNCLERHPRTAAGFSASRDKLVLAVVDGRSTSSIGMTCAQLAGLMVSLGAHDAINLDGGGSSTMWLADRGVVNRPSDGGERVVRNHLGVFTYGEGAPRYCSSHRALPPEAAVMRLLDESTSAAWGFTLLDLRLWPTEFIDAYPRGPAVEPPRLVRADGEPAVYLIDRGFRRHVPNPTALRGFHLHHHPIEVRTPAEVTAIPEGPPLTQFPYIAVTPAPHRVFLVDHPLPDPPAEPPVDAGAPAPPDGGAPAPDGGAPAPDSGAAAADAGWVRHDAAPVDRDASVGGDSRLTGGCAVSSPPGRGAVGSLAVLLIALARLRRRRGDPQ